MHGFDGTVTAGRKGIAYDWRSLLTPEPGSATPTSWVTDEALAGITSAQALSQAHTR